MSQDIPNITLRQKKILEFIVQEFVKTGEPVSSGTITSMSNLNCSSATIRNDMSKLEEMGFLIQPHTVSGRIPADSAYRFFVNEIIKSKIEPPQNETVEAIKREYDSLKNKTESLFTKTADMLSKMTNYTSMILAPQLNKTLFKYVKLIPMSSSSILLIMLSVTGEIIHKIIEVTTPPDLETLDELTETLNKRLLGKPIEDLGKILEEEADKNTKSNLLNSISKESKKIITTSSREIIVSGKNKVFDYSETGDVKNIKIMLDLLEQENIIAEILSETIKENDINIMIGSENPIVEMKDCSIITVNYKINSTPAGKIGILGPKRMPYKRVISIINYVAENIEDSLNSKED